MGDNSNHINVDDEGFSLQILIPDIKGWALVKVTDGGSEILSGEHVKGCSSNQGDREWDPANPGWGWEYFDVEAGLPDTCWQCGKVVPEEIVGIVAMLNWEAVAAMDKEI
jgi:hypothetical protein